ncbi:alpha/beta fold hydrolase [Euzebya sp.]|uniref:alpha/beta fold hydrolase n=1 Tax=Euzebya sp. TaxID=1971409 RepID=UPI0035162D5B
MGGRHTIAAGAAGLVAGAGLVTAIAGRSRPSLPGLVALNPPELPEARVVRLPDRGEVFVRDQPGPSPDAPTVVLLHGWVVSGDLNWFTSFAPLSSVARVIAPDHRGHGRGSRPSVPYRLVDVADDVAALIHELGTGPVVLVGYSMGGPISQLVWQRHPDLVAGLVECATSTHFGFGPLGGAQWRLMTVYQTITRLLPRTWLERVLLAQMHGSPVRLVQSIGPEAAHLAPLLPWIVGEIERGEAEDIGEAGRELSRFDSRGWIGGLDRPAAVIVTTRDRLVPPRAQLELAGLIPHALVCDVAADHDAPAASAGPFNEALVAAVSHVLAEGGAGVAGSGG